MKIRKILIRSGVLPFEKVTYEEMIQQNRLGSNVGNLVYAYSIYRTLMIDENVEFVPTNYKYNYTEKEIQEMNEEYECFIIPLADAIREDFVKELKGLTNLIKALKIPCYVIGIGLRAPYECPNDFGYKFDPEVKAFISAVLEKSSMLGVRGRLTAEYFSRLGFKEERDFTVIGCPSMYTFGDTLNIRDRVISTESSVCYNINTLSPDVLSAYICDNAKMFDEAIFIPQHVRELRTMYFGEPYLEKLPKGLPNKITDDVYLHGESRFFASVLSWIEFMKTRDFCFGSRLHGNIVATLAGTPSILLPFDARARELAEYHRLTYLPFEKLNEKETIFDLIEKVDFRSPEKVQKRNFDHYIEFLNKNGIAHIYEKNEQEPLLDMKMKNIELISPLQSITQLREEEIAQHLMVCHEMYEKKGNKYKEKIDKLEEKNDLVKKKNQEYQQTIKEQKKMISELEKELNYKSVQFVSKIRRALAKTGIVKKLKSFWKRRR